MDGRTEGWNDEQDENRNGIHNEATSLNDITNQTIKNNLGHNNLVLSLWR
jgi:hypothetical protein